MDNNLVIHETKPTKCTEVFVRYLHYNITLHVPTCFGTQRTFFRDKMKVIQHTTNQLLLYTTGVV
jgi:hypothetical protein